MAEIFGSEEKSPFQASRSLKRKSYFFKIIIRNYIRNTLEKEGKFQSSTDHTNLIYHGPTFFSNMKGALSKKNHTYD